MQMCYKGHMAKGGEVRHFCLISDSVDLVSTPFVYAHGKEASTGVPAARHARGKCQK